MRSTRSRPPHRRPPSRLRRPPPSPTCRASYATSRSCTPTASSPTRSSRPRRPRSSACEGAVLLLMRPRQSYIPLAVPRSSNRNLEADQRRRQYEATQRVGLPVPSAEPAPVDTVAALRELASLREGGSLSEAEFAAAKAKVLGDGAPAS